MTSKHPFKWASPQSQKTLFWIAVIVALAVLICLIVLCDSLRNSMSPNGMLSLQFAASSSRVDEILSSWDRADHVRAGLYLGLDYLFIVAYSTAIGLGCVISARNLSTGPAFVVRVGNLLAWGLILAAIFDVIENYALLRLLLANDAGHWHKVAIFCAIPKFCLAGAGLAYVFSYGAVPWLRNHILRRHG